MAYFPFFMDIAGQPGLIIGGGIVALRKVEKLLPYGPSLTVVSPNFCPELAEMGNISRIFREFSPQDVENRTFVIAASDDRAVNRQAAELCRVRGIPVNAVDDREACTFLFPALVRRGELSVGISTGGASPTAAAYFKTQLQSLLSEHLDEMLDWLEAQRPAVKAAIHDPSKRSAALRRMCYACLEKGAPLTEEEVSRYLAGENLPAGSVALVGAGCGKADLITLRGLRLLQQCQAVVYDDLIDPVLLDAVPESARKIYMGKRSGAHSAPQEEINRTLIALAREGLQVVRLKGGDPYLFGRGGEEMLALQEAGIPCQEVPGIPSAIGIPAEYGIPVTHRGVSQGLHIVTAHTADTPDGLPADFDELAKLSGTLVFLMGLQQLPRIVSRLIAAGKPGDTPAAVLSGGNSTHPVQVRATLSELEAAASAAKMTAPAIILVGEVAALELREP